MYEIAVNWSRDSIISASGYIISTVVSYDPFIIEYKIYNGENVEERHCEEMLYPQTGKPKGIILIDDL